MRRSMIIGMVIVGLVIAAAAAVRVMDISGDDEPVTTSTVTTDQTGSDDGATTAPTAEFAIVQVQQIPGDPRESVPSALADMEDEAFPDPLVEPAEIRSVGPPPDGIPPIDAPRFQEASTVDWLEDVEAVLLVEVNGEARAYPVQVMTWHEIVNDTFGDAPITVSYCPLCNSAITYVRTGQAVVGALTGSTLETLPATMVSWATSRDTHPDALVLSKDTGFDRQYGLNPYPGYDDVNQVPLMFKGDHDSRLLGRRSRTRRRHGRRASTKRDLVTRRSTHSQRRNGDEEHDDTDHQQRGRHRRMRRSSRRCGSPLRARSGVWIGHDHRRVP